MTTAHLDYLDLPGSPKNCLYAIVKGTRSIVLSILEVQRYLEEHMRHGGTLETCTSGLSAASAVLSRRVFRTTRARASFGASLQHVPFKGAQSHGEPKTDP